MNTFLGKKLGMTQIFSEEGGAIPVTVIEAGPMVVTQIKTEETDGYNAVQIGFGEIKEHKLTQPMKGHFAKAQTAPKRYLTEIRVDDPSAFELGQEFTVAELEEGAKLDVTGVSKGKGTQGNIKRHGHHRGPETHGSKHKRLPGGLAAGTYPSRVFKGNKAPGRMGRETTTVQNLELVKVLADRNVVLVKGAVPGPKGGLLKVRYAVKGQK
ncbi:MAG: 50S ribosomal protein L3 [Firmicutes bacterium]|nr:50S ribosomal protein L3 [Bacillota bacterium]